MSASATSGSATSNRLQPANAVNHYEALGVEIGAPAAEVRQAYLAAAREHHPDFHAGADEQTRSRHAHQMQVINRAWAVLGEPAAREQYDLTFRSPIGRHAERVRSTNLATPPGKSWTPRADDDGWQADYRSWADEDERLRPDRPEPRTRGVLAVIPVGLFALAVVAIFLGLVLSARPLVAGGFAAGIFSAVLFVIMPVVEMSRGRHRR